MRLSENHARTINDMLTKWQARLVADPSPENKYNFKKWVENLMKSFTKFDSDVSAILKQYPTLMGVLGGSVPYYNKIVPRRPGGCCG